MQKLKLLWAGLVGFAKGLDSLVNSGLDPVKNQETQAVDKASEEAYETGWDDAVSGEPRNNVSGLNAYDRGYDDGSSKDNL